MRSSLDRYIMRQQNQAQHDSEEFTKAENLVNELAIVDRIYPYHLAGLVYYREIQRKDIDSIQKDIITAINRNIKNAYFYKIDSLLIFSNYIEFLVIDTKTKHELLFEINEQEIIEPGVIGRTDVGILACYKDRLEKATILNA